MTTYRRLRRTGDRSKPPRLAWDLANRDSYSWHRSMLPLIAGVPISQERKMNLGQHAEPHWKRAIDQGLVILSLPLTLPLFAVIGTWVRISSPGPVLFKQTRVGLKGKSFTIYKFRSMAVRADTTSHEAHVEQLVKGGLPMVKLDTIGDVRMVPGGRLLRVTGLDELPQLINVVRGEMSLVGPRPCLPSEYNHYNEEQRERFDALPGLTGYWQVHGKNGTTFNQMVEMDIHYTRNKSLWLDIAIILRTPWVILLQAFDAVRRRIRPT